MKEIQKEKFDKTVRSARVKFLLTYFGHSNNMTVGGEWNGKRIGDPRELTDEQLVLLWQLVNQAQIMLAKEQARRDLLPEEIKRMYEEDWKAMETQQTEEGTALEEPGKERKEGEG